METDTLGSLFGALNREVGGFTEAVDELDVAPAVTPVEIRHHLQSRFDFEAPVPAERLIAEVSDLLRQWTLHVTHPRYFGLFNPSVLPITVVADALAALFNPQLAVWRHAPAANEMERHVLSFLSSRIGFDPHTSAAHFTSGGQEANMTAVLAALTHHFPMLGEAGLRALPGQPTLYVSEEGHHSFHKIAKSTGLGRSAVRTIPTNGSLQIDAKALASAVVADRREGYHPILVVGTAGTTSAGVVDPLLDLAELSQELETWFHVDAAWGGSALLSERLKAHLSGIERADSVTWDAHKWLSVPLGAGMFFCRRPETTSNAFSVLASNYVPPGQEGTTDNYVTTMQWSRRFIGLKLFMALAERGRDGFQKLIEHQAEMANLLRRKLLASGWRVLNDTALPVVCFSHPSLEDSALTLAVFVERLNQRGRCWISEVALSGGTKALRACITSYRTQAADIDTLLEELHALLP
jgi:glutamate/tyrosine decarboxylase-like PLP-dependent enzyme